VQELAAQLTKHYGKGFSEVNLWLFRQFYLTFADRIEILYPTGRELSVEGNHNATGPESCLALIRHTADGKSRPPFSPHLSWSHDRALLRIQDAASRQFYEREAAECGWTKTQLERQIQSAYYQRILANRGAAGLINPDRERLAGEPTPPEAILKSPYVLEFLGLPDSPELHESALEQAIIDNLQAFLLELGKGFSFVARQKHIRLDEDDFFIDLVFSTLFSNASC